MIPLYKVVRFSFVWSFYTETVFRKKLFFLQLFYKLKVSSIVLEYKTHTKNEFVCVTSMNYSLLDFIKTMMTTSIKANVNKSRLSTYKMSYDKKNMSGFACITSYIINHHLKYQNARIIIIIIIFKEILSFWIKKSQCKV